MKIVLSVMLLGLVLVGAGCAGQKKSTEPVPTSTASENHPHEAGVTEDHHVSEGVSHEEVEHVAKLAGSRIEFDNRNSLKPGEVTFTFKLFGLDGHEFGPNDLKVTHEKKMHFLVVRDDMTGFQHVHPEYTDGKWRVKTASLEQGQYELYVDVAPNEESPQVLRVPVTVGGSTVSKNFPEPNQDQSVEDIGYKVVVNTNGLLKTTAHTPLTFSISKNGKPVQNIAPYLGAYGHVVLLRHTDPDDFFHVHPITETKPSDGNVKFEAQFPIKGRYTLYAQFNVDGSVRTFPITVDVNETGADTDTTHGHGGQGVTHGGNAH